MRTIISLAIYIALSGLPTIAKDSESESFTGKMVPLNIAIEQKDNSELKALLKKKSHYEGNNCYVFYSNNQWFLLDKNGNAIAAKLLNKDKTTSDKYFMIKGNLHSRVISVKQISDISIQQF